MSNMARTNGNDHVFELEQILLPPGHDGRKRSKFDFADTKRVELRNES